MLPSIYCRDTWIECCFYGQHGPSVWDLLQSSSKNFSPSSLVLVENVLLSQLDCYILSNGLERFSFCIFYFFLGVLSLVLLSCIMCSCPSKLYPFHCPFFGPVISSPLNLTAVSGLTAIMSVTCHFILNLKLFLDLVPQLRPSSVLKSLTILTWLLCSFTAVPMWHLQETWKNLGNQITTRVNLCHFYLKSRAAELL